MGNHFLAGMSNMQSTNAKSASPLFHREDCTYTSCYCEENVYMLCKQLVKRGKGEEKGGFAVFVSNDNKKVIRIGRFLFHVPINGRITGSAVGPIRWKTV